jgi:DNA-binding XRE family transcriptional regulator
MKPRQGRKTENPLAYLSENLRRLRSEQGLSQAELAQNIWGNENRQSRISNLEDGSSTPSLAVRISRALGVTVDALIEKGNV